MIIPRIKVKTRVRAITGIEDIPEYILDIFIDSVVAYNTDTGQEVGDYNEIPLELFLYEKLNGTVAEPVYAGAYSRVIMPEDLDTINPMLFGGEDLRWGRLSNVRQSDATVTLMPATNAVGGPLALANVSQAQAPKDTYSRSGYYKSRVFSYRSKIADNVTQWKNNIMTGLGLFLTAYINTMNDLSSDGSFSVEETLIID